MPASTYSQLRQRAKQAKSEGKFSGKEPSFILYMGVLLIALLKDLLDFTGVGSFPAIGTVVTMCFTFLIWILLLVFDRSGGRQNKQSTRGLILVFIGVVEGIGFGLNFLPIETMTVILLYQMAKRAYQKEQKRKQEEQKLRFRVSQSQASKINRQLQEYEAERIERQKARSAIAPFPQTV